MHKHEAYEVCKKHVGQFVMIQTKDGQSMNAFIENVDAENVYLAVPVQDGTQSAEARYPYTPTGVYPGYGYVPGYSGAYIYPLPYIPWVWPGYYGYGHHGYHHGGYHGGHHGGGGHYGGHHGGYRTVDQARYPYGFGGFGYPYGFGYPWYYRRFAYPLAGIAALSLLPYFFI